MRTMHHGLAAIAFAALGSLVALAQAPQQPPAGQAPAPGAQAPAAPGQGRPGGAGRGGAPAGPASFFVTSAGKGDGANYGGLAGADAYCAQMAQAGGIPTPAGRTWRAYLSATAAAGQPAVNARDRIGAGPWYNINGALIANNVADLHGDVERDRNQINKTTALTEKKAPLNGVGDTPNQHDIITGSDSHGRARASETLDTTCTNYTSNQDPPAGTARGQGPGVWLGHHDRTGGGNTSWNAAHKSSGCSQQALVSTGGAGALYCFAAN
jgi:hypothetical protein